MSFSLCCPTHRQEEKRSRGGEKKGASSFTLLRLKNPAHRGEGGGKEKTYNAPSLFPSPRVYSEGEKEKGGVSDLPRPIDDVVNREKKEKKGPDALLVYLTHHFARLLGLTGKKKKGGKGRTHSYCCGRHVLMMSGEKEGGGKKGEREPREKSFITTVYGRRSVKEEGMERKGKGGGGVP